jgi:hypothetical protein
VSTEGKVAPYRENFQKKTERMINGCATNNQQRQKKCSSRAAGEELSHMLCFGWWISMTPLPHGFGGPLFMGSLVRGWLVGWLG